MRTQFSIILRWQVLGIVKKEVMHIVKRQVLVIVKSRVLYIGKKMYSCIVRRHIINNVLKFPVVKREISRIVNLLIS